MSYCISAATGAAADMLGQMIMNYLFDPNIADFEAAWNSINWLQVGRSALESVIVPGGPLASAIMSGGGDVAVNALTA